MYTLTSKVGRFTFENNVPLGLAKLVRDTAMGWLLGDGKGKTAEAVQQFMLDHQSSVLASVRFDLKLR